MNKMFKRVAAAVFAGLMIVGSLTMSVFAEEEADRTLPTDSYYAYIGLQTDVYAFRDPVFNIKKGQYGYGSTEFGQITYWDADGNALDSGIDMSKADAEIKGNGTYTLTLPASTLKGLGSTKFNMLYFSTNIPRSECEKILFTDFTVKYGDVFVTNTGVIQNEKDAPDYIEYMCINEYSTGEDGIAGTVGNIDVPEDGTDITITFTVSGMDTDNPDAVAPTDAPTEAPTDAPAADSNNATTAADDSASGLPMPAIIGIVAGVVVVVVVVIVVAVSASKKKKDN